MGLTASSRIFRFPTPSSLVRRGLESLRTLAWRQRPSQSDTPCLSADESEPEATAGGRQQESCEQTPPSAPLVDSEALTERLRESGAALAALCARTETDFLDLGGRLQTIQVEAQQLTQTIVAVLADTQEPSIQGALKSIEGHAAGAIEEISSRRQRLAADLLGLRQVQADLGALGRQNQQFKEVAKNLKMVGLAIHIESARSQAATAAFQALAEEIGQLAGTVYSAVGHIGEDTRSAEKTLHGVNADIGQRMHHLEKLITEAQASVHSALDQVAHFMALTMDALDRMGEASRKIGQQVGRLVVSVQIHDNISQRAAHIREALEEACPIIVTASRASLPEAERQAALGRAYGIVRLQMAQLQTIVEDVASVRRESDAALDALFSTVAAVTRDEALDTLEIGGPCPLTSPRTRHPVTVLTRELERLIALFDEGLDDIRRLAAAREQTGRTMARMNSHIDQVRDINFDIRLKALNAVIRSSRLGDAGRAIAAIVNEMKALAEQSNTTIGAVTGIMERISGASQSMDSADEGEMRGHGRAGALLRQGIEDFAAACNAFKSHSRQALETGQELEQHIREGHGRLLFFDSLSDGCHSQLATLTEIQDILQPFAEAAPEDWLAEEQRIMARYTMDRERQAHLGLEDSAPAPDRHLAGVGQAVPAAATADVFDDNVELF